MPVNPDQYDAVWESPVGMLGVCTMSDKLLAIDFLSNRFKPRPASNALSKEVILQLKQYFSSRAQHFDLPLAEQGTDHQQHVWQALRKIPTGKTVSYGQLATRLGSGARAVGNACRHNPLPIVVPCHRVVAANGIGGYAGAVNGVILQRKLWLLEHEGALRTE